MFSSRSHFPCTTLASFRWFWNIGAGDQKLRSFMNGRVLLPSLAFTSFLVFFFLVPVLSSFLSLRLPPFDLSHCSRRASSVKACTGSPWKSDRCPKRFMAVSFLFSYRAHGIYDDFLSSPYDTPPQPPASAGSDICSRDEQCFIAPSSLLPFFSVMPPLSLCLVQSSTRGFSPCAHDDVVTELLASAIKVSCTTASLDGLASPTQALWY